MLANTQRNQVHNRFDCGFLHGSGNVIFPLQFHRSIFRINFYFKH